MNKLNEQELKAIIAEAVRQELAKKLNESEMDEILGLSRSERNAKWGYQWDPNLSAKQNRRNRDVQKAMIRQQGYNNHAEYEAGEGRAFNQQPQQQQPQQPVQQAPDEYPYKADRQKTAQFQTWFNQNFGGQLQVDGIWGPRTEQAYKQWLSQQNQGAVNEVKKLNEAQFKKLIKKTISEILGK